MGRDGEMGRDGQRWGDLGRYAERTSAIASEIQGEMGRDGERRGEMRRDAEICGDMRGLHRVVDEALLGVRDGEHALHPVHLLPPLLG